MVHIRQSEYGRAFSPRLDCYAKIYEDNLDFRHLRRKSQQAHHNELFEWDDSSSSDNEEFNCERSNSPTRTSKLPPHKYKHEKYTKRFRAKKTKPSTRIDTEQHLSADRSSQTVCQCQRGIASSSPSNSIRNEKDKPHRDHGVQTPDWNRLHDSKSVKSKEKATVGKKSDPMQEGRPKKPTRGVTYHKPLPKPRPMSAPLGRPSKKVDPEVKAASEMKAPFVPYGFLDRESETAVKKTHNVRASTDVYPAAMRALRRRQVDINKREEDLKKTPYKAALRRDPFMEKMAQETAGWETEYRQHYVPYHANLYQTALSVRLDPKKYAENLSAVA